MICTCQKQIRTVFSIGDLLVYASAALIIGLLIGGLLVALKNNEPDYQARISAMELSYENTELRHIDAARTAILGPSDPIGPAARLARTLDSMAAARAGERVERNASFHWLVNQ